MCVRIRSLLVQRSLLVHIRTFVVIVYANVYINVTLLTALITALYMYSNVNSIKDRKGQAGFVRSLLCQVVVRVIVRFNVN